MFIALPASAYQQATLAASNSQTGSQFARSVAIDGGIAVVGAPDQNIVAPSGLLVDAGAAYVYERSATGGWDETEAISQTDVSAAGDRLGSAVAVHGDTVILGAYEDNGGRGSALVYERSADRWLHRATLVGSPGGWFGFSVALHGDTALIGAPGEGAVYVFTRSAGVWTARGKVFASDGGIDFFGYSVALDDNRAVVGAPFHDGVAVDAGAVYIFAFSNGVWTEQVKLVSQDPNQYEQLGVSVALDENLVVAGAPYRRLSGTTFSGGVYVFSLIGATWEQSLITTNPGDFFGLSVAVEDDAVIVGSPFADGLWNNSGAAYVFTQTAGVWQQRTKITAIEGGTGDWFGYSIAVDRGTAVVGGPFFDGSEGNNVGRAFVFTKCPLSPIPDSVLQVVRPVDEQISDTAASNACWWL